MNRGRFFSLDLEESALNKGIALFNYRPVCYNGCDKKSKKRYKYPIYLAITRDEMSFYMSCFDSDETLENDSSPTYRNCPILTLSVSSHAEIRENLTKTLVDVYSEVYPAQGEFSQWDTLSACFMRSLTAGEMSAYSSLAVFNVPHLQQGELLPEKKKLNFFLRKLLLDFMFDMEHSEVFKNAPHIDFIYSKLNSNFLFYAIRNKAEYYYQRELAHMHLVGEDGCLNAQPSLATSTFLLDYYLQAEKRWVDTITDTRALNTFNEGLGWLMHVERELDAVYQTDFEIYTKRKSKSNKKNKKAIPSLLRAADYIASVEKLNELDDEPQRRAPLLEQGNALVVDNARSAVHWYVQRYCFSGIFKVWFGCSYCTWRRCLRLLFLALIILVLAMELIPHHWEVNLAFPALLASFLVLARLIPYGISPRSVGLVGGFNIFLPRLLAAIITAWFTLIIGENIFKGFFDQVHSWGISLLLIAVTYIFVYFEIDKLNPFLRMGHKIRRAWTLIGIAFVYSIASGIMIMNFFGTPYMERSESIEHFYTHHIYIDKPKYEVEDCAPYVHQHFYEAIESYDSELSEQLLDTEWKLTYETETKSSLSPIMSRWGLSILESLQPSSSFTGDPSLLGCLEQYLRGKIPQQGENQQLADVHIRAYLDDCDMNLNFPSISYPVTLKFLAEFARTKDTKLGELHHNMVYGSLVTVRFKNLRDYLKAFNAEGRNNITLTRQDLAEIGITYNAETGEIEDRSWICLLNALGCNKLYRKTLAHLTPTTHDARLEKGKMMDKVFLDTEIYRNMLFQFSFIAMFIGIFLQLIFADKPVTEPI